MLQQVLQRNLEQLHSEACIARRGETRTAITAGTSTDRKLAPRMVITAKTMLDPVRLGSSLGPEKKKYSSSRKAGMPVAWSQVTIAAPTAMPIAEKTRPSTRV